MAAGGLGDLLGSVDQLAGGDRAHLDGRGVVAGLPGEALVEAAGSTAAGLGACAYAIASPWIPPRTVWAFVHSEEFRAGGYTSQPAGTLLALAAALAGLFLLLWLFRRLRVPAPLRFAILFLYPTFLITMSSIASDPALMPHRLRFHLVMEMGIALAAGRGGRAGGGAPPLRDGSRYAAFVLLAWCAYPAVRYAAHARED